VEIAMSADTIIPLPPTETSVYGAAPHGGMFGGPEAPPHQQQNLAKLVHRLLRGRYLIALTLAAIGAIGGSVGGYLSQVPKYKADGYVRIQSSIPKILYNTEQSAMLPMFNSYVSTQASFLQQERVLNRAMSSEAWRQLKRPVGPDAEKEFRASLKVVAGRDSPELISVSFTDEEANAAFIAVQEIINSYEEIYGGTREKRDRDMTVKALEQKRTEIDTRRRGGEWKIQEALKDFETDDLTRLHDYALTQLLAAEGRVAEKEVKLAELGIDPKSILETPQGPDPAPGDDTAHAAIATQSSLTPEQIAAISPEMARLLTEQSRLKRSLARNRSQGYGDLHPAIVSDTADLAGVETSIQEIVERYAASPAAGGMVPEATGAGPGRELLISEYRRFRQQADAFKARTASISQRQREIETARRDIKSAEEELGFVLRRLDEINTESKAVDSFGGRIEKILPEGPPGIPTVDPRRKMAAVGFALGGGVPLAFMLLLGLIDRRFRYADQARDASLAAPMLGILPELPTGDATGDPEQNAAAVHCVHHIRSLLQMNDQRRKVYVITSPTAGDGKTSLALSLAMSFTASGSRTLVMDFDLIGCGLTSRLNASRSQGLGHALTNGAGNGHLVPSGVPGLDLIPAGRDDARSVNRISRKAVSALIDEYRDKYDSILIDTGPALGSLEANLAASVADGVILVVGRGQHADRVQEAIRHIGQLGATVVGMVFNRAHSTDFARSSMSKSFRSLREGESREPKPAPPVVSSMAISISDPLARQVESDIHR
jgi:Mrp family chromosome partitioning ATPase/uncharacterized protein involved in exopolysaccharide biosynthesis